MLFLILLLASLNGGHSSPSVRHFHRVGQSAISKDLLDSKLLCGDIEDTGETVAACEEDFRRIGKVWKGDVNDDAVDELVIFPGLAWDGSGGDSYIFLQRRGKKWFSLFDDWFTPDPRFDILPVEHRGYHDLRIASHWCVKWNGQKYVSYSSRDYHRLSPKLFDSSDWSDADICWLIYYRGRKDFHFIPQWFPSFKNESSINVGLDDSVSGVKWIALFKGGVWGVLGNRAFLLLPQPDYRGSEHMEIDGEWLVIHAERDDLKKAPHVVARYNRRTHEMIVFSDYSAFPG